MFKKNEIFDAWLNVETGTIIPWDKSNERLRLNENMKRIKATIDPETNQAVDVNSEGNVVGVAASGDLTRMMAMLRTVSHQRITIMAAALQQENGEQVLIRAGLYDPEVDDAALINASDEDIRKVVDERGQSEEMEELKARSAANVADANKGDGSKQTSQPVTEFDDI